MSSSLGVRIEGKRYVVKTTPMMKLEAVLEDALKQAQKQWTTSDCAMTFNKKKLDLGDPVRFCNVPTGSNVDVEYSGRVEPAPATASAEWSLAPPPGRPPRLVDTARAAPAPSTASQPAAQRAPPQPAINWDAPTPQAPGSAPVAAPGAGSGVRIDWGDPPERPSVAPVGQEAGGSGAAQGHTPEEIMERRGVVVFTREELKKSGPSVSAIAAEELPPSYFNLTPDDYHRLMAQRQRSEGTQPQTLKTRALREAEELRKAREAGVVHIRYLLPDAEGTVVQADMRATHKGKSLLSLLRLALADEVRDGAYLYTTPPKKEMSDKDMELNLLQLGFVPNANVHVGFRAPPPPRRTLLSQAAQARRGEVPALPVKEGDGGASAGGNGAGNGERAGGEGPRGPAVVGLGGAAEFRESELARNDQVHKPKVPRWFKGGK